MSNDAPDLEQILHDCNLQSFQKALFDEEVARFEHLEDVTKETLLELGFTKTQATRLQRRFEEQRTKAALLVPAETANSASASSRLTTTSHSELIESDTVNSGPGCSRCNTVDNPINRATDVEGKTKIALPKGFCNKDGGNIICVSTASLKHRYMDVWYELPNSLKQKLSNSFILSMCQSMEAKFRNIRQLTDWARKERGQRLKILFALHPLDEDGLTLFCEMAAK